MRTTFIYSLSDPITSQVRYIGKANNVSKRYEKHLEKRCNNHKIAWISGLRNMGLKPILDIIEEVSYHEWVFWEQYWISQMRAWGFNLVNQTNGGEGREGLHSQETKDKISKALLGHKQSNETRLKRIKSLSGSNHYLFGKKRSAEVCKKLSESRSGMKYNTKKSNSGVSE